MVSNMRSRGVPCFAALLHPSFYDHEEQDAFRLMACDIASTRAPGNRTRSCKQNITKEVGAAGCKQTALAMRSRNGFSGERRYPTAHSEKCGLFSLRWVA